jgi:hypothetical protein
MTFGHESGDGYRRRKRGSTFQTFNMLVDFGSSDMVSSLGPTRLTLSVDRRQGLQDGKLQVCFFSIRRLSVMVSRRAAALDIQLRFGRGIRRDHVGASDDG